MKLPNWFKISWWILVIVLSGILLFYRIDEIINGQSVPVDVFIFLLFVALMLVPIFSEISFFGVTLKKEIDDLKTNMNLKFGDLKNEIHNSQTQTLYQTIQTLAPPPPDNKLPELEEQIERIIKEKFSLQEIQERKISSRIDVPDNNLLLFKTRYNIEVELRRIWEGRLGREPEFQKRPLPIYPAFSGINICTRLQEFYKILIYKRITYLLLLTFSRIVHIMIYAQFEIKAES